MWGYTLNKMKCSILSTRLIQWEGDISDSQANGLIFADFDQNHVCAIKLYFDNEVIQLVRS